MKLLSGFCLLLFPVFMQAQALTLGLQQSTIFYSAGSFQYLRGIYATYDAPEKPYIWALSVNHAAVESLLNHSSGSIRPRSHTQTGISFANFSRSFKEVDVRLATFYKKSLRFFELLAGAELILGRTSSRYEYYEKVYIKDENGDYLQSNLAMNPSQNAGPTNVQFAGFDVNYLKYGIAPKLGTRYALTEHFSFTALLGMDLGRRAKSKEIDYEGPALQNINARYNTQLSLGVGFRF